MTSSIRISVDHDKCVGSRICIAIASKAFQLNKNGQAEVANLNAETIETIRMAADACPVTAITVEELNE